MVGRARHGWRGDPPGSEAEARERIVGAAMRCVDRYGPGKTGLSDVADELGVTRQTVYRYFAGTDDLLAAVARSAADGYLDRLARHLAQVTDPVQVVVEALAFTIQRLPEERYLGVLLTAGRSGRSSPARRRPRRSGSLARCSSGRRWTGTRPGTAGPSSASSANSPCGCCNHWSWTPAPRGGAAPRCAASFAAGSVPPSPATPPPRRRGTRDARGQKKPTMTPCAGPGSHRWRWATLLIRA